MGVIEGGVVHGVLPETEAFAVNYPAYPSSTARAIETLGGIDEIAKRRSSKNRYLELRFRPEDPDCHPAFGDLRRSSGLLLRISTGKGCPTGEKAKSGEEEHMESSTQLRADVVARVRQAYHFQGMADYQYVLPVHAAKSRKKKRGRSDAPELRFENGRLMDLDEEEVMMLVPPLFSPKDIPEQIVLKPAPNLVSKQMQKGVVEQRWEKDMEPCLALPFSIEKIPGKVNWESHISMGSTEWQCQSAVCRLLDEKPVWPRNSLNARLVDTQRISDHQMRRLLARAGYYFATGPFGKFWIRKGYDPRKDPDSKIYQRIDFRVPEQLRKVLSFAAKDRPAPKWKDLCNFQALPMKSFTSFQFYELGDDYIRQEITKPAQKKNCTHSTGWLSKQVHEILSLHVKVRFLPLFDDDVARNLLKSNHKQLEKNKRLLLMGHVAFNEDDSDADNGHRQARSSDPQGRYQEGNEPVSYSGVDRYQEGSEPGVYPGDDDNEAINQSGLHPVRDGGESDDAVVEDEEEEEEEEEDEDGGHDEYGSLSLGGVDQGFTLNPCSHGNGEDLSVDYLQDILSGFRSRDGRGKAQETDTSDGEYQIYEQESDSDSSE